jgi:hypothetical protein
MLEDIVTEYAVGHHQTQQGGQREVARTHSGSWLHALQMRETSQHEVDLCRSAAAGW